MLISAGFDGHTDDPLAQFKLTTEDYYKITKRILETSRKSSKGKVVSILKVVMIYKHFEIVLRTVDALLEFN